MAERAAAAAIVSAPTPGAGAVVQRKCACGTHTPGGGECSDCARERVMRKANGGGAPSAHPRPLAQGHALDRPLRHSMEAAFSRDFSAVRVHTDAHAAASAQALGAAAYTVGDDIVFGANRYAPASASGLHLIAHELAHVAQRAANGPASVGAKAVSDPGDAAEIEADQLADRALAGEKVRPRAAPGALADRSLEDDFKKYAAPVGIGLGVVGAVLTTAYLLGAFDRNVFSETDLRLYLDSLARSRGIEDHRDSDNKARDLVRRWAGGDKTFDLDAGWRSTTGVLTAIELKRLLILEMLSGHLSGDDENGILSILERASADEVRALLDARNGLSVQALDRISGDNRERLDQLLESRFPSKGKDAARERARTDPSCSARQVLMIDQSRREASALVSRVIGLLSEKQLNPAVTQALACRFPGATPAQVQAITNEYRRILPFITARTYRCLGEFETVRLPGSDQELGCMTEYAWSFAPATSKSTNPLLNLVLLCPQFFRQPLTGQVITIIHESAHRTGLIQDVKYEPGCDLKLADALRNPDSYAYFASDLAAFVTITRGPPLPASGVGADMPRVTIGNFRNHGPVSKDNKCPACSSLPGLGLDDATGLNIMEVRGDIAHHSDGVEYDFKRTKERAIWRLTNETWELLKYDPPGSDDDPTNVDEDLDPKDGHLYSTDGPGLPDLDAPGPGAGSADEYVYRASFVEIVHARKRNGPWMPVSNEFKWHSVTWLVKVNGVWQRKAGANEVEAGAMTVGTALPWGPGDFPESMSPDGTAVV